MVMPSLEVVITNVGTHTIDDENTEDGKKWAALFGSGVATIPGIARACWGRSQKDPAIAMHFIDYETRKQHDTHKALIGGPVPDAAKGLMDESKTDLYSIIPHTSSRRVLYAPQTNVVFFWGIDEDKFAELSPEFFTAINQSDACLGYIWGEVNPPVLADPSGNMKMGKGGIMISGWKSREEHDRDVGKPRVMEAYKQVCTAVKKSETWGMQVVVVENNGWEHRWHRLEVLDRSKKLASPGFHDGW